jgi:phosphoglycolate phosphatase
VVLFDLDGTLIDPRHGITRSVQAGLAAVGVRVDDPDALIDWIGPPLRESFAAYTGLDPAGVERAVTAYRARFDRVGWSEHEVYPGVPHVLARLRASGWRVAVATSKPEVFARRIVDHVGFTGLVEVVAGSELDGRRSAKREVIDHALDGLGQHDREVVVMVGDREHDMIGAVAAGVAAVGVTWGYGTREELVANGAEVLVDRPCDLPGAIVAVADR